MESVALTWGPPAPTATGDGAKWARAGSKAARKGCEKQLRGWMKGQMKRQHSHTQTHTNMIHKNSETRERFLDRLKTSTLASRHARN